MKQTGHHITKKTIPILRSLKIVLQVILFGLTQYSLRGQNKIELADNTIKISGLGSESFYYSFSRGDTILFSFNETNKKDLKKVEFVEFPGLVKFTDFKTSEIKSKKIIIRNTGIYFFRFANSSMRRRVCQFHISRTPKDSSSINFNTTVGWETRYDTTHYSVEEDYLISRDTHVHKVLDQMAKVHSKNYSDKGKTTTNFVLPKNTVAWSYYIGVNQEGKKAFEDATKKFAELAEGISGMSAYGPMASLALHGVSYFSKLQKGEDIVYYLVEGENRNLFLSDQPYRYYKNGTIINDFAKMSQIISGNLHFCLKNENAVFPVEVTLKVTAITVTENWGKRNVPKFLAIPKRIPIMQN